MINKYRVLNRAKYFSSNRLQNYLVFQLLISHFITKNVKISSWMSKAMSQESIALQSTIDQSFYPEVISLFHGKYDLKFERFVSFLHKNIVDLYITYKLDTWSKDLNTDFKLGNYLFRAVKLTKNVDPNK